VNADPVKRPCDVCVLVDNDWSHKACKFCSMCGAWMCDGCRGNAPRRALAAAKRIKQKVTGGCKTCQQAEASPPAGK
jgi:hypothetical protein